MLKLDHIAVAAQTLDEGVDWIESRLGVQMCAGGEHPLMGTHNRLLGLADGLYLEVIAINPVAPKPAHSRWFDLDNFAGSPRLTNWILRSPDIVETLADLPLDIGYPLALSRGDFRWQMAVPSDGKLPFGNCFPAVISWHGDAHPADRLPQSGCRLKALEITHPDADSLQNVLSSRFSDPRLSIKKGSARLRATIATPDGERTI